MSHLASHAHARDDSVFKYNLASPTRDITIPNLLTSLLSQFASLLTQAQERRKVMNMGVGTRMGGGRGGSTVGISRNNASHFEGGSQGSIKSAGARRMIGGSVDAGLGLEKFDGSEERDGAAIRVGAERSFIPDEGEKTGDLGAKSQSNAEERFICQQGKN